MSIVFCQSPSRANPQPALAGTAGAGSAVPAPAPLSGRVGFRQPDLPGPLAAGQPAEPPGYGAPASSGASTGTGCGPKGAPGRRDSDAAAAALTDGGEAVSGTATGAAEPMGRFTGPRRSTTPDRSTLEKTAGPGCDPSLPVWGAGTPRKQA